MPASEAADLEEAAARMAASVRDAGALALSMFGRPIHNWTKLESSPVSEVTIAGHLSEMFASLIPANDLVFRYGTNAPTLRVEGMTVAGQ